MGILIILLTLILIFVMYKYFKLKNELRGFSNFIDSAIEGKLSEIDFNERETSKLKSKIYKFLSANIIREEKLDKEKTKTVRLISDISHQTKTPLTNLNIYINLLERGYKEEYIEIINYELKKLDFLIQNLVKSSRLESDVIILNKEKTNFKNLVEKVLNELSEISNEKNIKVEKSLEEFDLFIDKRWMAEAIHNLIENAIKYAPPKSKIQVKAYKSALNYNFDIENESEEIIKDEIAKLFNRFYRGKNSVEKDGFGLGLFIAREIIEKDGGQIKVHYKDKKIKFLVDFPL